MKKLLILIVIIGAFVSFAEAKSQKIFDLKDQYFSGTLLKKSQDGYGQEQRYDAGKVYVTTDTKFNGKTYKFGLFTVDIKEPLENWNVIIKKYSGASYSDEITTIRLTSNLGNSYVITYNGSGSIQINDKNFKVSLNDKKSTVTVSTKKGKTIFLINGQKFLKIDSKNFGKLAKVEIELNVNYMDDKLYALEIYKVE